MFIRRIFVALMFLVMPIGVGHASEVVWAPMPDWVVPQQIPKIRAERLAQVEDGIYYLLFDQQVRHIAPSTTRYFRHVAYQVTERSGLEDAASLDWTFDPSYERLTVHSIRIFRGDEAIDLTGAVPFTIVRRETDLDRGLLNGELTAHADLQDVRVGDVIETAISRDAEFLIAKGHLFLGFKPNFSVPLGRFHYRVTWPAGMPVTMRQLQDWTGPEIVDGPAGTAYTWAYDDLEPVHGETYLPSWYRQWGAVWLSSMRSWGEVVDALLPYYDIAAATLPPDFAAKVDRIAAEATDRPERIARALRLVQDQIRYVGIEIGPGAFIPRPPETVVARGFGDCKDKSVLLAAALHRLGFDAAPALVNLTKGRGLRARPPSPFAFDHMIVHVRDGERTWWLDPTGTYQGGLGADLVMPEYGNALPIRPGQADLVEIPDRPLPNPTVSVVELFDFAEREGSVNLVVTTTRTNYSADWMRRTLAKDAISAISRRHLNFYDKIYPDIREARPLAVSDDRDANKVTLVETYQIPAAAKRDPDLFRHFPLRGSTLIGLLAEPPTADRRGPIGQAHPIHLRHEVIFRNPPIPLSPPQAYNFDGRYFQIASIPYELPNEMGIEWTLRSKANEIPAKDAPQYVRDVERYERNMAWNYDLGGFPQEQDEPEEDSLIDSILRQLNEFAHRQQQEPGP
jgi:hypothetical protein